MSTWIHCLWGPLQMYFQVKPEIPVILQTPPSRLGHRYAKCVGEVAIHGSLWLLILFLSCCFGTSGVCLRSVAVHGSLLQF